MKIINSLTRLFVSTIEIPIFFAALLAIIVIGERKFFGSQVSYQTSSCLAPVNACLYPSRHRLLAYFGMLIGQWGTIVLTIFTVIGEIVRDRGNEDGVLYNRKKDD
jgi:hypothetical protein